TVSVIDGATNAVTATISVGYGPQGVAVDPSTNTIYTANFADDTVSVIDGATNVAASTISVGSEPMSVAVDPTTNTIYVTNSYSDTVSVISGSAGGVGTAGGPLPVTATNGTSVIALGSGVLSFVSAPANPTFPALTLDGKDQTTSATLPLDVGDNTGSGAGWNVTITSTQFSDGSAVLPSTATSVTAAPSASCDIGSSCTPATLSSDVTYPLTVPAGSSAPTATRLYSAAAGSGMGDQTISPTFTLAVPANTAAGAYSSDWTLSLVSGP
ncbi:MAG: YncE family protein, partial [Acidimicrobiales bacterium]